MSETKLKIHLPPMPDYLYIGEPKIGRRQDGLKFDGQRIDVADLTDEQIFQLAQEWLETMHLHVALRRLKIDGKI